MNAGEKWLTALTIYLPLFLFSLLAGMGATNLVQVAFGPHDVPAPLAALEGRPTGRLAVSMAGDTNQSGETDIDDIICVNSVLSNDYSVCAFNQADIFPCQENTLAGDGLVDAGDLAAIQTAFAGEPLCQNVMPACTANEAPTADLEISNIAPLTGAPTTFQAKGARDNDPGPNPDWQIVEYRLDFGDGEIETVTGTKARPVWTHAYQQPGTYVATLTVLDRCNATDQVSSPVTVLIDASGRGPR